MNNYTVLITNWSVAVEWLEKADARRIFFITTWKVISYQSSFRLVCKSAFDIIRGIIRWLRLLCSDCTFETYSGILWNELRVGFCIFVIVWKTAESVDIPRGFLGLNCQWGTIGHSDEAQMSVVSEGTVRERNLVTTVQWTGGQSLCVRVHIS